MSGFVKITSENYVSVAESKIKELSGNMLSTSQIRNLLSMVMEIYNDIVSSTSEDKENAQFSQTIIERINYLKLRFWYEAGRDDKVKQFIEKANVIEHIEEVIKENKKSAYMLFTKYMEGLVAYRYYSESIAKDSRNFNGARR